MEKPEDPLRAIGGPEDRGPVTGRGGRGVGVSDLATGHRMQSSGIQIWFVRGARGQEIRLRFHDLIQIVKTQCLPL